MPTRSRRLALAALLALAIGGLPGPASLAQGAERYAVVVSPDVPVVDVSLDELRRLFSFSKRFWSPGRPVTVLYSDDGLVDGSFMTERVYRMEFSSIRRLILEKLYQGELDKAPKVAASDRQAVEFVASGRGLIAVVHVDSIGGAAVKVLQIDGHAIQDAGYPLSR